MLIFIIINFLIISLILASILQKFIIFFKVYAPTIYKY